jgi:uncharacterized protein YjiS (DUF1127 family)
MPLIQVTATDALACTTGRACRPLKALYRWWRERRMIRALNALDDASLKDIGVYRCGIHGIARDRCANQEMF